MRTGTVATTDNRNRELLPSRNVTSTPDRRFSQNRAIALDMESATTAANGFRFLVREQRAAARRDHQAARHGQHLLSRAGWTEWISTCASACARSCAERMSTVRAQVLCPLIRDRRDAGVKGHRVTTQQKIDPDPAPIKLVASSFDDPEALEVFYVHDPDRRS
jgi:hypothetical protein